MTAAHYDGTVVRGRTGSPWSLGKQGASLRLKGGETGTYAHVQNLPKATGGAISVCAWVFADSRPRWASIANNWARDGRVSSGDSFILDSGKMKEALEVHVHDGLGNEIGVRENQPLPLSEWHLVAFTLDGTTLRLYRNGTEVAETACGDLSTVGPTALGIGVILNAKGRGPELSTPGFGPAVSTNSLFSIVPSHPRK